LPNFILEGTKADVEQMLGNAVQVKLAQYVATSIQSYIDNKTNPIPLKEMYYDYGLVQLSLF